MVSTSGSSGRVWKLCSAHNDDDDNVVSLVVAGGACSLVQVVTDAKWWAICCVN